MADTDVQLVEAAKVFFDSLQDALPQIMGDRTIFGSMPDWNPAEIVGFVPSDFMISMSFDSLRCLGASAGGIRL